MAVYPRFENVYPKYVGGEPVIRYILAELRENSPLDSREIGGILRREFGISGWAYREDKREIMEELSRHCHVIRRSDLDVNFYYRKERFKFLTA